MKKEPLNSEGESQDMMSHSMSESTNEPLLLPLLLLLQQNTQLRNHSFFCLFLTWVLGYPIYRAVLESLLQGYESGIMWGAHCHSGRSPCLGLELRIF